LIGAFHSLNLAFIRNYSNTERLGNSHFSATTDVINDDADDYGSVCYCCYYFRT